MLRLQVNKAQTRGGRESEHTDGNKDRAGNRWIYVSQFLGAISDGAAHESARLLPLARERACSRAQVESKGRGPYGQRLGSVSQFG